MASHVHVSKSSTKSQGNKAKIHHMPCKIKRDGPANVSKYFEPIIRKEEDGTLTASFRGRPLSGKEIHLPENYSGFVLQETQKRFSEEYERNLYVTAAFDKFTYWNYDETPSSSDQINAIMDWIDISSALHSTIDS